MIREIRFSGRQWEALRSHLLRTDDDRTRPGRDEQLAFILAAHSVSTKGVDLVVHELLLATADDLEHQSPAAIGPTGDFVAKALSRCRQESWSLIEAHSHPFDNGPHVTFSGVDWGNDRTKMPAMAAMLPESFSHATMVFGQTSVDAHSYDRESRRIFPVDRIVIVGPVGNRNTHRIVPTSRSRVSGLTSKIEARYDRQAPLLGSAGQQNLSTATVAIVGLGGLGSFVAVELAHLGVGELILIDHDVVDETNLNRLVGAKSSDVGELKVRVYESLLKELSPKLRVTSIASSILDDNALHHVKSADVIAGCVDNHGARLVMNHLAVQYLIPLVDAGTGARIDVRLANCRIGGQVQLVTSGAGCLECRGFIDPAQAAFDLAPPSVRASERAHGYGFRETAPSVIFLNGVVASIQVSQIVTLLGSSPDIAEVADIFLYDALRQTLVPAMASSYDDCPTCGSIEGMIGLADLAPLRQAEDLPDNIPNVGYPG